MPKQPGFILCLAVLLLGGASAKQVGVSPPAFVIPAKAGIQAAEPYVWLNSGSGQRAREYLITFAHLPGMPEAGGIHPGEPPATPMLAAPGDMPSHAPVARRAQRVAGDSWPTFRGSPQRTGRSEQLAPSAAASRWTYDLRSMAYASAALDENGTVYVASADSVHAVTASGKRLWATAINGTIISSPALNDGSVYVGSTDGNLYALSAGDGSLRWTFTTGDEIWASPAVDSDGTVYVGSFDGNVYAIDGTTGQRQWAFATGGRVLSSVAIDVEGLLYVGSTDGNLYALYSDGSSAWTFATAGEVVSSPAIGEDGTVYVGSADERLYAIHPNGTLRWAYAAGAPVVSSPAVTSRGAAYVASYDGKLHAVGPEGNSLWQPIQMDGKAISSPSIDSEGTVLVGSLGGTLYGVDGEVGVARWTHRVEGSIWSSPTLGPDRTVYVAAYDSLALTGALYAVGSTAVRVAVSGETEVDRPVTIEVTLLDEIPAASGWLYFRRAGERVYQPPVPFQQQGEGSFSAAVPAEFSTLRGIEYYVVFEGVEQMITHPIFEPETRPAYQPVRVAAHAPDLAMRPRVFRMISVPLHLDDPSVGEVLDEYGPPVSSEWRLFRWENGAYQEYPRFDEHFEPGQAFFLVTKDGQGFTVENGASVSTAEPYTLTLQPGLTQIGNPYAFPVSWDDVSRDPEAVQLIAYFDSETNEMVQDPARLQTLQPWQGYFVRNRSAEPVTIAFPTWEVGAFAPGLLPGSVALLAGRDRLSINVQVHVQGTDLRDTQNWIGMAAGARDGEDLLDVEEAPPIGDFVRLSITGDGRRYAASYKPPEAHGQSWDAELTVSDPAMAGRVAEIRHTASSVLPEGVDLYVINLDNYSVLPASDGLVRVTLPEGGEPRRLRFVIGTEAFASDPSNAFGAQESFDVEQNYPNPFGTRTTIRYYLDEEAPVTVTVFDILGRSVATLVDEVQQDGWHEVIWDGRNGGVRLAGGMYLYRVTAGPHSITRTMLLIE